MRRAFSIVVLSAFLCTVGCSRKIIVTEQVTWECAPDEYESAFSAKPDEYARFRYGKNPDCFDVESAKNLCAVLRSVGKPVVSVEFQVRGGPFDLFTEGYQITCDHHADRCFRRGRY